MKFKVSVDIECGNSWDFEVDREKLKPELRELPAAAAIAVSWVRTAIEDLEN